MTVDYRDGVSILQLIIYLPYLFASIYVCYRHGFMKNSGWIYLVIFCTIRIVGSCAQLATINSTSTTPYTIAAITSAIGISPLLLSSLGLISRAYYSILKTPWNVLFSLFGLRIPQTITLVGLILCIVAATSSSNPAEIEGELTLRIGICLYLASFLLLTLLTVAAAVSSRVSGRGEHYLIPAVACSLPFILVRILYATISAFDHDSSFNFVTGSVTIMLVMAVLEEFVVVAIYTITGLKLETIQRADQSTKPGSNLAYRTGRGDFGMGKLGLLSLLIAAIGEIRNFGRTETDGEDEEKAGKI